MKKFFPLFLISIMVFSAFALLTPQSFCSSALEVGVEARVIASHCDIYSEADFSSERLTIIVDQEEKPLRLKHGEIVDVVDIQNDFALVETSQHRGYVYKYYLTQNTPQTVYPVCNATIRRDTQVLDMDFQPTLHQATKGTRVFIYKSYTEKKGHTSIQLVLDDQTIYNGYVLTKDVKPDGISGLLIAGISIIAAAVTVVLSIVFIKKKKKR